MDTQNNLADAYQASIATSQGFQVFKKLSVCSELSRDETLLLYTCFEETDIKAGSMICWAGTSDHVISVIVDGSVAVTTASSQMYRLLKAGDAFGLYSFLDDNRGHSVSAKAIDDVRLLTISREYLNLLTLENRHTGHQMMGLLSRMAMEMECKYALMQQSQQFGVH